MRSAGFVTDFADSEYAFKLTWGGIVELQELTDCGPWALLRRLQDGTWKVEDIAQTIRLALIGGDPQLNTIKAKKLVDAYVKERPLSENIPLARTILLVALFGGESKESIDEKKAKEGEQSDGIVDENGRFSFQSIYGAGAVMGFTPAQVNEMSIWQFRAAYEGYVKAHSPDDNTLSESEKSELFDMVQEHM